MSVDAAVTKILDSIVPGEAPLVESLVRMHLDTQEQSGTKDVGTDGCTHAYRHTRTVPRHTGTVGYGPGGHRRLLGSLIS